MCDDCETETIEAPEPVHEHLSLTDVVVVGLRLVGNILGTTGAAVHALANLGVSHDLWKRDKEAWAELAGHEIEAMTSEPDA